jgi:uroporphyrinogen III methyltransferase/synthase
VSARRGRTAEAGEASAGGRVYLVGAGPGDPGLLTVRAVELVARADVVVHDRLIPAAALDGARADAEVVDVGKRPGEARTSQAEIQALLVERARAGKLVVRLKGGDPFVFGRGGEEAEALREAGVEYEVVPGVTAGVAAPAYAGIPVTHRDAASAVAFVTGHEDPEKAESLDWAALARFPGTLVLYMGVRQLPAIAKRLVEAGRPADEAAAVIERGTLPGQRTVTGTLGDIAERAAAAGIGPPAITVVGPVARLRERLAWLERRPLHGRTVAVTRARAQASELAARLRALGAAVVEAPAIRIDPLSPDLPDLATYDLVCLTSPNGVRLLFDRLREGGAPAGEETDGDRRPLRDARAFAGTTVAAIGPGTARALRDRGVEADVVPERSVAEALVEALRDVPVRRALVARAREARDVVPDALRERGAEVDVVELYETVAEPLDGDALAAARTADYVTFTSSSTVRFFLAAAGGRPGGRVVSIGPVTSATLREHGIEPDVEATRHDVDGVVAALLEDAAR